MNNFSLNIQILRKAMGWGQGEVAAAIGFKRSAWGNYETGASVPTLADSLKIANYFGISLTQLIETDLTDDVRLMAKVKSLKKQVISPAKSAGNSPAKGNKNELREGENIYLLDVNVVAERLKEKDAIIEAQRGQIEALKLAVSQLEHRLSKK